MASPSPPPPPNPPPSLSRIASSAVPRAVFDCIQKFHAGTNTMRGTTTTNLMRGNTHARISLNVAGGCATAVQWLLAVPRASNTVLDAKVLYSRESVAEALAAPGVVERATHSLCSRDTAKDLAKAAYRNAIEVHYARRKTTTRRRKEENENDDDDVASAKRVLGVGATCAFVSNRPKKGEHRCFVSVWSKFGVTTRKVTLDKESGRSREEEDRVASECLVRAVVGDNERWMMGEEEEEEEEEEALGRFSGTDEEKSASWKEFREDALTFKDDKLEFLEYAAPWFEMSNDKKKKKSLLERWLDVGKESRSSSNSSSNSEDESRYMPERSVYSMHKGKLETIGCSAANVVLSGSFNPIHEGHQGMLEAAVTHLREKKACEEERTLSVIPAFELSISNADKGQLDTNVVVQRAKQFDSDGKNRLVLTRNAPLFTQKAKLLPNTVFVVGYDTAVRLVDPKYYDDSVDVMVRDLRMIKDAHNCSFLVCGRKDTTTGTFKTLADVTLPAGVFDVFEPLENFRNDVSSTEIRASSSAREEEEEIC